MGHSKLGAWLVVALWCLHAPPCNQRLGDNTPCHADAWPGFGNIMPSYAFLRSRTWITTRLVNFHQGLSRAVTFSFCAVIFTRLQSCRLGCHQICASAVLWLAPTKMGWSALDQVAEYAIPSTLEVYFRNSCCQQLEQATQVVGENGNIIFATVQTKNTIEYVNPSK